MCFQYCTVQPIAIQNWKGLSGSGWGFVSKSVALAKSVIYPERLFRMLHLVDDYED